MRISILDRLRFGRFLALTFAVVVSALTAVAQIADPVHWSMEIHPDDATSGSVVWTAKIEAGYHIYGTKSVPGGPQATKITLRGSEGFETEGNIQPSKAATVGIDKTFELELSTWSGTVTFTQRYKLAPGTTNVTVSSEVEYMACTETSCLPPKKADFSASIGDNGEVQVLDTESIDTKGHSGKAAEETVADTESGDWWKPVNTAAFGDSEAMPSTQRSAWMLLLMGFVGGLLALLTPCVWPMIPMTLSFFLKKNRSRRRSIGEALIYGFSIIVIFLVLGIAITLIFGAGKLNEIATSAVFNIIFFLLLVIFAISFFGAFEIRLPSKWSNAADGKANTTSGLLSVFFMAFTLVLVSFSCTGPIIGTLLVEAASNGSILGPATGMGGFALGLAIPFSLFAFFPSLLKEMPKAGGWMNSVKVVLGFIELILSLKFLSVADLAYGWRILDREVFLSLWIVLFVLLGMYLLGKLRFPHDAPSKNTSVGGFFLAVASFSFAVYLVPGLWGAPLKAISAFAPPLYTQDFNLYKNDVNHFTDYDEGMRYAAEKGMPVLLDFSGKACVNCRKMEGAVFDTEEVRRIINNDYVMITLMVDERTDLEHPYTVTENGKKVKITTTGEKWSYLQRHRFNINSQPYYVLLDNQGRLLNAPRAYDENVEAFVEWLGKGLENYKKTDDK